MSGPSVSGLGRVWHRLSPIIGLALFVAAVAVLGRELRHMPPAKLAQALKQFPPGAIGLAMVYTALNYLILTGYDQLAFLYIRRPIATMADRDGVVRRVRHRQQRRLRAALGHVGPLSLLLALGAERPGHLARRALLLGHVLARPARPRRLDARERPRPRARDVRPDVARAIDRLGPADDGARVPGGGDLQAAAAEHRRHADRDAVPRPRRGPVRAVRARLEPGRRGALRRCCRIRGRTSSCSSVRSSPRSSSRSSATCPAALACSSR